MRLVCGLIVVCCCVGRGVAGMLRLILSDAGDEAWAGGVWDWRVGGVDLV